MKPILSTKQYSNRSSDHDYAKVYGWTFDCEITSEDYLDACEVFDSISEIENMAEKLMSRKIRFRKSLLGRLIRWIF